MPILIVLVALSLSAGDIKIAAPDLEGVGISAELRTFYTSHLGQKLQMQGLSVITAADIKALISQERQKELIGCAESESCAVELGAALGADTLLTGTIAKLGNSFQVNVKVMSAVDGKPLAFFSGKASSEEDVTDTLDDAAEELGKTLKEKKIPRRAMTSAQRSQRLLPDTERRDGAFILRNSPTRETGRRLMLAGLIGIPVSVGFFVLAGVGLGGIPAIIGGVTALLSLIAIPTGLALYLIGKQEKVPVTPEAGTARASLVLGNGQVGLAMQLHF